MEGASGFGGICAFCCKKENILAQLKKLVPGNSGGNLNAIQIKSGIITNDCGEMADSLTSHWGEATTLTRGESHNGGGAAVKILAAIRGWGLGAKKARGVGLHKKPGGADG